MNEDETIDLLYATDVAIKLSTIYISEDKYKQAQTLLNLLKQKFFSRN